MKKAEEYFDSIDWDDKWSWDIEEEVEKAIKQAQVDAYNEAITDTMATLRGEAGRKFINEIFLDLKK